MFFSKSVKKNIIIVCLKKSFQSFYFTISHFIKCYLIIISDVSKHFLGVNSFTTILFWTTPPQNIILEIK